MRHDAHDDLEGHEADDQQQRNRQVSAIGIGADVVRVASVVMVVAGTVVVAVSVIGQLSYLRVDAMISRARPEGRGRGVGRLEWPFAASLTSWARGASASRRSAARQ